MLNKYIFERALELFWIVVIFASIVFGVILALIFLPFMGNETSIMLGIAVFSVILFLPVFVVVAHVLGTMRQNAKRMIAYANGNYTYSAIMRESIKQAGTPENALYRFREMVSEQLNQAATDKKIVEINQTIQKFKEAKRDLH
jgi:hypothetical protein